VAQTAALALRGVDLPFRQIELGPRIDPVYEISKKAVKVHQVRVGGLDVAGADEPLDCPAGAVGVRHFTLLRFAAKSGGA